MKKILLFSFIIIGFVAKSQEYDEIWIRDQINLGDSGVTVICSDTLVNPQYIRNAISNISENEIITDSLRAKNDSIYMKSPISGGTYINVDSVNTDYLIVEEISGKTDSIYLVSDLSGQDAKFDSIYADYVDGVATVAGNNYEIQYALSNQLAASANLKFNDTTLYLKSNIGDYNIFIGDSVGKSVLSTTDYCTFIGTYSGIDNTADNNTFYGFASGFKNTTGGKNTFLGNSAGYNNLTGSNNTIMGYFSGYSNTGSYNTFMGYEAGYTNSANNIIAIGVQAGYSNGASIGNTYIGYYAGQNNSSGGNNTYLGYETGAVFTGGTNNVLIGYQAGKNTTGDYNVYIGEASGLGNLGSNNVLLGYQSGYTGDGSSNIFIGYQAGYFETESNKLYIHNTNTSTPLLKGDFSTNELWFNVDTAHNKGHSVIDSNLYLKGKLINEIYEIAYYLDPDSTITTAATTDWKFLGDGSVWKFTTTYSKNFSFSGDTIVFNQSATDPRDSVEFRLGYSCTNATSNVNKTVYFGTFIKHIGESVYFEYRPYTKKSRTITADVYYPGPICSAYPVYLKDGDKIKLMTKIAAATTTISTQDFGIYIREQH
jgi:hypothetical protein